MAENPAEADIHRGMDMDIDPVARQQEERKAARNSPAQRSVGHNLARYTPAAYLADHTVAHHHPASHLLPVAAAYYRAVDHRVADNPAVPTGQVVAPVWLVVDRQEVVAHMVVDMQGAAD